MKDSRMSALPDAVINRRRTLDDAQWNSNRHACTFCLPGIADDVRAGIWWLRGVIAEVFVREALRTFSRSDACAPF